jgi:hypothetical protein
MEHNAVLIRAMDLSQRTKLIKCCQAQLIPNPSDTTTLRNIMKNEEPISSYHISDYITVTPTGVEQPFLDFIQDFRDIQSPVGAAIILDLARGLPLNDRDMAAAQKKGWGKEVSILETDAPEPKVNWRCFFREECADESCLPELDFHKSVRASNLRIQQAMRNWRDRVSQGLFYPRMTFKSMSRDTVRDYERFTGEDWDAENNPIFSQIDWQRFRMNTGYKIGGCMELRQVWYTSQAKPRTYAANGGDAYGESQFLQDPFTDLVNSLIMCNHKSRLRPGRLRLKQDQWLRVYDLEAFTSRMHEQKNMLNEMSLFCSGWPITVFDVYDGVTTFDLGELIWKYNQVCNYHIRTSYERIDPIFSGFIGRHCYASLLGIFGNLMTCTMGHTMVMDQVWGDDDSLNVAGDDGAIPEDESVTKIIDACSEAVGLDEPSKRFRSDEAGAICLKRPIYQFGTVLEQGYMIIPPTMTKLAHVLYGYEDPRYAFHDEFMDLKDRYNVAGKEVMRFLRSAYLACEALSTQEKRDVLSYTRAISELFQIDNSIGCLPSCGNGAFFWPSYLQDLTFDSEVDNYFVVDPLVRTIENNFTGSAEIPMCDKSMRVDDLSRCGFAGMYFKSTGSKHLKLLRQLGFLESEIVTVRVEGFDALEKLRNVLEHDTDVVYEFHVVEDIPIHMM